MGWELCRSRCSSGRLQHPILSREYWDIFFSCLHVIATRLQLHSIHEYWSKLQEMPLPSDFHYPKKFTSHSTCHNLLPSAIKIVVQIGTKTTAFFDYPPQSVFSWVEFVPSPTSLQCIAFQFKYRTASDVSNMINHFLTPTMDSQLNYSWLLLMSSIPVMQPLLTLRVQCSASN